MVLNNVKIVLLHKIVFFPLPEKSVADGSPALGARWSLRLDGRYRGAYQPHCRRGRHPGHPTYPGGL